MISQQGDIFNIKFMPIISIVNFNKYIIKPWLHYTHSDQFLHLNFNDTALSVVLAIKLILIVKIIITSALKHK